MQVASMRKKWVSGCSLSLDGDFVVNNLAALGCKDFLGGGVKCE